MLDCALAAWPSKSRIVARHEGTSSTGGRRVAIYAHYASSGRISQIVFGQLAAYVAQGFEVIFVTMMTRLSVVDLEKLKTLCHTIVVRRTFGRDFGAWRDTLALDVVNRTNLQELLLVNDTILGPIYPLDPLFTRMRMTDGVWGLVNSLQNGHHLQTFFVLANGTDAVAGILDFFDKVKLSNRKEAVIEAGELALGLALMRQGIPVRALYGLHAVEEIALSKRRSIGEIILSLGDDGLHDYANRNPEATVEDLKDRAWRALAARSLNPTHQLGEVLVRDFDFPFIKAELIAMNPCRMTVASTWRSLIPKDSPCTVDMIEEHLAML
jgi:hypothetical protein